MNAMKVLVEQLERKMRGPFSIAFFLVKRGIFTDLQEAYDRVCELGERPDISALLRIGTMK